MQLVGDVKSANFYCFIDIVDSQQQFLYTQNSINQIYSGITCGRVLNGGLYTRGLYKLIYLC